MKRPVVAVMAVAMMLTMSACGGKAGADGNKNTEKEHDAQLAFSQCMRDNGVTGFPDPQFQANGGATLSLGKDGDVDPESQVFKDADAKCRPALEKVMGENHKIDPKQQKEDQEKLLAYAQCMRDHGVDMDDPQFDGDKVTMKSGPNGGDKGASDADKQTYDAAQQACRDKNPMPGGGPGGNGPGGDSGSGGATQVHTS